MVYWKGAPVLLPRPVTEAEQHRGGPVHVEGSSTCRAASFERSETRSRCGGPFLMDRRPEEQFVTMRSSSLMCEQTLSGSRCAAGCMFLRRSTRRGSMMRGSSRDKGRSISLKKAMWCKPAQAEHALGWWCKGVTVKRRLCCDCCGKGRNVVQ